MKHVPETAANMDWRSRAECRDLDPDLFFPVGTTGPALEQIEKAKKICRACVVREECLEYALTTRQDSGVWGGTSEEERRVMPRAKMTYKRIS